MAYIGSSPTKVVSRQSANIFTYTATANQTAFTGSDANGNTLACTPSDIMVHMNGLRLEKSDYVATTTTVTLGSGAAAGDEVTITAFVTFETADAYTKSASDTRYVNTAGDTMTGALQSTEIVSNNAGSNTNIRLQNTASGSGSSDGFVIQNATNSKVYLWNYENADVLFGTNSIERLKINSSGPVTMPSQPAMSGRAIRPIDTSGYVTTGVNLYVDGGANLEVNNGNHWNNSTGVWTCPVAGRYFCYAAFLIDNDQTAGSLARYGFKKNGSEFFISYNHDKYGSSYGGMATAGGIFNCAANDTITCVASHGKFHAGGESSFSICFLG